MAITDQFTNSIVAALKQSFEEHLLPRYQQLESSEQKIILFAALVVPFMIIVFGIMLPLQDKQNMLQNELSQRQEQATEAGQLANYINEHGANLTSNNSTESLLIIVERLARQSKVRQFISRIKPQNSPNAGQQQLMLRLKSVPYTASLRFIHALAEHGLGLKSMKLQATKTPGLVNLYAMIKRD